MLWTLIGCWAAGMALTFFFIAAHLPYWRGSIHQRTGPPRIGAEMIHETRRGSRNLDLPRLLTLNPAIFK